MFRVISDSRRSARKIQPDGRKRTNPAAPHTYELLKLASQNIVETMPTLESTFGRPGGMLKKVLGTRLRGLE
jgi:hypothetical protein